MKKALSLILCAATLIFMLSISAAAIPLSSGDDALRAQFGSGSGGGLTYKYFAPEAKPGVKYPVVVWLHGIASGNYDGDQIDSYDLCKWASDEYQARFANAGGAYILCPRASGTWDLTTTAAVKNCVESFVSRFENSADRSRIYLMGFSIGASMTIKTASAYSDYFAAAVPVSAIDQISASGLKNMAVWFFANEKDSYVSANVSATRSTFNSVAASAADKSKIRFTAVSKAVDAYGNEVSPQHYMWRALTNDMFMADGSQYAYSTTTDGTGKTISFTYPDGVISWLSRQIKQTPAEPEKEPEKEPENQKSFWDKLLDVINAILKFLSALFGAA